MECLVVYCKCVVIVPSASGDFYPFEEFLERANALFEFPQI